MKIKLLIPLYNDWQSLLMLLKNIDHQITGINNIISITVVNDGSIEKVPDNLPNYSKINSIKIINLKKNIGHARSIATGLKFILENDDFDHVIPMDSDGEDRPEEINELIKRIDTSSNLPIVCERVKRSESRFFKFCYFLHKLITYIFTGKSIRFGNFTCLPKDVVKKMTSEKATWSSFSGALSKVSKNKIGIPSKRGFRYFGPSKMSFKNLVVHSLSIISVFKFNVLIRSVLFSLIYTFLTFQNITLITVSPLIIIFILNVLVFITSTRENLEDYKISYQNILDVKVIN